MFKIMLRLSSIGTFMNMKLKKKKREVISQHFQTRIREDMATAPLLPLVLAVQQIFHRPSVVLLHCCPLNV